MGFESVLASLRQHGRKALVVGLGISGVATARFLSRVGISVLVTERQKESEYCSKSLRKNELRALRDEQVDVRFGVDGDGVLLLLSGVGLAVVSPGVPLDSPLMQALRTQDIPVVSELELGVDLHGGGAIIVTGSNGKSTTATLIDHILRTAGVPSYLCGNVGTPVIASPEILSPDRASRSVLVVEASSYQLEASIGLRPRIAVVLNISENHLERHGSLEAYAAAKARALALQNDSELAILNADDPIVLGMRTGTDAAIAVFGARSEQELSLESTMWARIVDATTIIFSHQGVSERYSMARSGVMGIHNCYNAAAAIIAARRMGVAKAAIQEALDTFKPLEHRLEAVENARHYLIFNDSKSTTVAATVAAFSTIRERYPQRKVLLLIGGLSKAGSWQPLVSKLQEQCESLLPVICFGKDGPLIAAHCQRIGVECHIEPSLSGATSKAVRALSAQEESVLLLSPGCASFDEFSDFEHRGREFKAEVQRALENITS